MSRRRRSAAGQPPRLLVVVVGACLACGAIHPDRGPERRAFMDLLAFGSLATLGMTMVRRAEPPAPTPGLTPGLPGARESWRAEMRACLELAARNANLGYWELDPATGAMRVSAEWKLQLGYRDEDIPHRLAEWESWVHPEDLARTRAHHRALAASRPPCEAGFEHRLRHRDGSYHWMQARARLIAAPDQRPRLLGCNLDITQRREVEQQFRRQRQRLHEVEQMSEMGVLIAGVAHEVRNPLFGITATLDAMEARGLDPAQLQKQIVRLRGEVDRVSRLMSDLLDYGRPRSLMLRHESPQEAVRAAIEACRVLAEDRGVEIDVPGAANPAPIQVDRERMATALQNVIRNAIEHSAPGSRVTITCTAPELEGTRWVGLQIRDRGPGFEPAELDRVFEPFHSRRVGGIGLGLAIARRIIRAHGGVVTAANAPDGGGLVEVRLPVSSGHEDAGPRPQVDPSP